MTVVTNLVLIIRINDSLAAFAEDRGNLLKDGLVAKVSVTAADGREHLKRTVR